MKRNILIIIIVLFLITILGVFFLKNYLDEESGEGIKTPEELKKVEELKDIDLVARSNNQTYGNIFIYEESPFEDLADDDLKRYKEARGSLLDTLSDHVKFKMIQWRNIYKEDRMVDPIEIENDVREELKEYSDDIFVYVIEDVFCSEVDKEDFVIAKVRSCYIEDSGGLYCQSVNGIKMYKNSNGWHIEDVYLIEFYG